MISLVNATNQADLSGAPLTVEDIASLTGISRETAIGALLRRVNSQQAASALLKTTAMKPGDNWDGILFPYITPGHDAIDDFRLRLDFVQPYRAESGKMKTSPRYMAARASVNRFYYPPGTQPEWLQDISLPVIFTEGEKKSLALFELSMRDGKPLWLTIGISGVWNWKGRTDQTGLDGAGEEHVLTAPLPDFDDVEWTGRRVIILFDSDAKSNGHVKTARSGLSNHLLDLGTKEPDYLCPPMGPRSEKQGVDDWVGSAGPELVLRRILQVFGAGSREWPVPQEIQDPLPGVPEFDYAMLPEAFRDFVRDVAIRKHVPPECVACSLLVHFGGATGRRFSMYPMRFDTGWRVWCCLWGGMVMDPSSMKTAILNETTRPLSEIEKVWRAKYDEAFRIYMRAKEEWNSNKKNRSGEEPQKPPQKRVLLNDATKEKMHELLCDNPRGMIASHDELAGWLAQLEANGREGERQLYLKGWSGDSPHSMDRIMRGSVYVDHVCLGIFGASQPSRVRQYMRDTVADGFSNDGLWPRFQLFVYPDRAEYHRVDQVPDRQAADRVTAVFKALADYDEEALRLRFAPDAQELFLDWLDDLEGKRLRDDTVTDVMRVHLGKFRSLVPILAMMFELADWAANGHGKGTVSLGHLRRAIAWSEFLEHHAVRIYSAAVPGSQGSTIALADLIRAHKVGDKPFTLQTVQRLSKPGLLTWEQVRDALSTLEDAGWLRSAQAGERGGRPSIEYTVNPAVYNLPDSTASSFVPQPSKWTGWQPSPDAARAAAGVKPITLAEALAEAAIPPNAPVEGEVKPQYEMTLAAANSNQEESPL